MGISNTDAFKINEQSIYSNLDNAYSCCINMLDLAQDIFNSTFISQNIKRYEKLCIDCHNGISPEINETIDFAKNNLIDNIKISICFENYFKALLLSKMNVIHEIDKNIFPDQRKLQENRPISILEFKEFWEIDGSIKTDIENLKLRIKGFKKGTIIYSWLLNKENYINYLECPSEIVNILNKKNRDRNRLHLNNVSSDFFSMRSYRDFQSLNNFVKDFKNTKDKLCDEINLPEEKRKKTVIIRKRKI